MLLGQVASQIGISILTSSINKWGEKRVQWGYSSDLLSFVIAEANPGDLWITKQVHLNIVAVASLNELSGIVVCGKKPDKQVLEKAIEENIPILYSNETAFETAGKLYKLLVDDTGKSNG